MFSLQRQYDIGFGTLKRETTLPKTLVAQLESQIKRFVDLFFSI